MLAGVAFSLFAVDLFKYPYGLLVALLDTVKGDILVLEFEDIDIAESFAAAECVLLFVLGVHAYGQVGEVLTAVERPVADALDCIGDNYLFKGSAP